jgi:hexosaminidase
MRLLPAILIFGVFAVSSVFAQSAPPLKLMPVPSVAQVNAGELPIRGNFTVGIEGYRDARLEGAATRFLRDVERQTGLFLNLEITDPAKALLVIHADQAGKAVQELGEDESYVLDVTASGAKLSAANSLGVMRGLQTFLQLIEISSSGFAAPAVHIEDAPRFPWRGLSIDVSRHFIYVDTLKRNIDAMEAVKLNVLHLHLSDDQGFRVESKDFPKLTGLGSDGLFYTQAEIRDLIAYAADRGIRIVPEFDMPGHSTAWFVGYPSLSSGPGPYSIERRWGIFDPAMDPTREDTYKFLDKFIGEMAELFPDHYFHIGGDEVNGKQWDANPKIREFMRAHKLKNDQQLQQYFTLEVQKIVAKHHKVMVGWDEILSPGMPETVVIQSWRGQDSLAEAAKQGYRGILSSGYYLDAMEPAGQYYLVDPLSNADSKLSPEEQKRILGGEACLWAEFVSDESIDSRIWPSAAAIAERLWSPQQTRDVDSMYARLSAVGAELQSRGLTQRSSTAVMLQRISGATDISKLEILSSALQPASITIRETEAEKAGGIQTSDIPLNRMVDAIPPESEAARQFSRAVDELVASKLQDSAAEAYVRQQLTAWRENDGAVLPVLQRSSVLAEVIPVSKNLAAVSTAGLQALEYVDARKAPPQDWKTQQTTILQQAAKPTADLVIAVLPAVQKLMDAASAGGF